MIVGEGFWGQVSLQAEDMKTNADSWLRERWRDGGREDWVAVALSAERETSLRDATTSHQQLGTGGMSVRCTVIQIST